MRSPVKTTVKRLFFSEAFSLGILSAFIIVNWFCLINISEMGPPDFYKYWNESNQIFSGNFFSRIITPLFPFLLEVLGKFLSWTIPGIDSYILAGRLIGLFAGFGVLYYTYRLIESITNKRWAFLTIIFVSVSSLFLKFLVMPLTDMLFLAFVMMSLFYFSTNKLGRSILSTILGILTRFEGILLVFSGLFNYIKLRWRSFIGMLILFAFLICDLFYLFVRYYPRIIAYIENIFEKKTYRFFLNKPFELSQILYGNILFFIPPRTPDFIKFIIFYLLLSLFILGLYKLFQTKWQLAIALFSYLIFFVLAKGYVVHVGLNRLHERRMLSFIYLFFIVSSFGIFYLIKTIQKQFKGNALLIFRISSLAVLLILLILNPFRNWKSFMTLILMLPVFVFSIRRMKLHKLEKLVVVFLIFCLTNVMFIKSSKQAAGFVSASANKGGYVIASWLNENYQPDSGKVAVFSSSEMIEYYLKHPVKMFQFDIHNKKKNDSEFFYWQNFLRLLKQHNIRYVIFDDFLKGKIDPTEKTIKELLRREINKNRYFKVIDYMKYKKRIVAAVVEPLYWSTKTIMNEK